MHLPVISLKSEYVLNVLGLSVTNTFLTSVIVTLVLSFFAILFCFDFKKGDNSIFSGAVKSIVWELMELTDTITGDRALTEKILPIGATFIIFIAVANILALLPGFLGTLYVKSAEHTVSFLRSPNSDLTTTLALTLVSVFYTQINSMFTLGIGGYFKRFVNLKSFATAIQGFFELLSEFTKIISFSFRLFGNIFAGEVVLLMVAFFTPYFIPLPLMILELFIGIIQAFIFGILTLNFIRLSTVTQKV